MRFILKDNTKYVLVIELIMLNKGQGHILTECLQAHIAIKIKGTVIFPLKSNTLGHQQRNNRFSGCKVNIPVPVIGLSIMVFFFFFSL